MQRYRKCAKAPLQPLALYTRELPGRLRAAVYTVSGEYHKRPGDSCSVEGCRIWCEELLEVFLHCGA